MKRIVVCGLSNRALGMFIEPILTDFAHENKIVGLLDIDDRRIELCKESFPELYSIPSYNTDQFDQMIKETNADTIIVTSRDDTHIDYILQGLEQDLTVITEKPMVTNANDAVRVMEAEQHSKGKVIVAFNYRYGAFHRKIKELILEGKIGRVTSVDYYVYMDGKKVGSANNQAISPAKSHIDKFYADPNNSGHVKVVMHNFTATDLKPKTNYQFTVRAVDRNGNESNDSNTVSQSTTAVPKVFNIKDYGAVGDGKTLNTEAIQKAIDECTPGGKVLIPEGIFKSGAIWLKSDLTLEVAEGATLLGSENANDYHITICYMTIRLTSASILSSMRTLMITAVFQISGLSEKERLTEMAGNRMGQTRTAFRFPKLAVPQPYMRMVFSQKYK